MLQNGARRLVVARQGLRAFERAEQALRLDERQAEGAGELLARVRASRQLAQRVDRVGALVREPVRSALEALRVRAEVERLEQREKARSLGGRTDLFGCTGITPA